MTKSRTNPDNLSLKQIAELDKLGLLSKSKLKMNPIFDVLESAKVSGPIESVLRGGTNKKNRSMPKFKAKGGRVNLKNGGKVARGCGKIMSNRRKKTKIY